MNSASGEEVESHASEKMRQFKSLEHLFALNRFALEGPLLYRPSRYHMPVTARSSTARLASVAKSGTSRTAVTRY
jgi:hypothetical protein